MSARVTVLLVDELQVVREALRARLAAEASLLVAGEAADGAEAIDLVTRLAPDLLLLHLPVPGLAAAELIRRAKRLKLPTRIVVLSATTEENRVAEAMAAGADGYVGRDATTADLVYALHEVAAGRRYLSPPFTEQQLERHTLQATHSGADLYASLTGRERQVMELAARGLRNREIAEHLGISPRTAESHRAKVMSKLGIRREADLVRFALRHGILPLDGEAPEVRRSPD
jgi:DNA-binding NarL/FixJ family response regulator